MGSQLWSSHRKEGIMVIGRRGQVSVQESSFSPNQIFQVWLGNLFQHPENREMCQKERYQSWGIQGDGWLLTKSVERGRVPPLDYIKHNELVSFPVSPSIPFPTPPCVHQQVFRMILTESLRKKILTQSENILLKGVILKKLKIKKLHRLTNEQTSEMFNMYVFLANLVLSHLDFTLISDLFHRLIRFVVKVCNRQPPQIELAVGFGHIFR